MIAICLSLVGLVSLAGCKVQERSDLETAAETIQVPSLPTERWRVVISRKRPCLLATLVHCSRAVERLTNVVI
jgi:hypothetical protein